MIFEPPGTMVIVSVIRMSTQLRKTTRQLAWCLMKDCPRQSYLCRGSNAGPPQIGPPDVVTILHSTTVRRDLLYKYSMHVAADQNIEKDLSCLIVLRELLHNHSVYVAYHEMLLNPSIHVLGNRDKAHHHSIMS